MSTDREELGSVSSKASSMFSCGKKGKSTGSLRPRGDAQSSVSTWILCLGWSGKINVLGLNFRVTFRTSPVCGLSSRGASGCSLYVLEKIGDFTVEVKQKQET